MRCVVAVCLLVLVGCDGCEKDEAKPVEEGAEKVEAPSHVGVIEGVVTLAAGAELPSYPLAKGPETPEACPPATEADRQPVTLAEKGRGLAGLLVSVTGFEESVPHEPETHEIRIEDCRLTPSLVAATRGDELVVTNKTDYPFLPVSGKAAFARGLLKDESRTIPLERGGVTSVTCAFASPCGRTDVIVQYHPLHDITGEGGRFRIEGVPVGEGGAKLRVHAWHPLFEEASTELRVAAGETARVELTTAPADLADAGVGAEGDASAGVKATGEPDAGVE